MKAEEEAIQKARKEMKYNWVKVWDYFPDENKEVLVSDGKFVHEAVLHNDKWWSTDSANPYEFHNVSYWI